MKFQLKFEEGDFDSMRVFEKAVKRQLGNDVYVGTNNLCFYFTYPKELVERIRPLCPHKQLEFEFKSSLPGA